jgi:hypothetical protein
MKHRVKLRGGQYYDQLGNHPSSLKEGLLIAVGWFIDMLVLLRLTHYLPIACRDFFHKVVFLSC